jgi:DNA helicase-2/ATP-dependent DNA helicase PcrA
MRDLLAGLDEEQRIAAQALNGSIVILAGAGSGKTRTVTHRIAYGVETGAFDPKRTMALTFTTRAAAELGRRLAELDAGPVATRTFHSAALRQLRYFWPDAVGGKMAKIVPNKQPLVSEALRSCGESADAAKVRAVAAEIEWCKAANIVPDTYEGHAAGPGLDRALLRKVYKSYEEIKSQQGAMDFEDVLLITIGLLESRSDMREEVRRAYRWFTVDEFQDVSPLQMRLLNLWLGRSVDICAVGDPAQSIYGFAGADSDFLTGFKKHFPAAQVLRLNRSYRCAPHIVDVANRVASQIPSSLKLISAGQRESAAVQVLSFPDEEAEASGVAEEIAAMIRSGQEAGSIACLYRTNAQSAVLQAGLQQVGLSFAVRNSERFFDRSEVREAVIRLRGQARANSGYGASEAVVETMVAMGMNGEPANVVERDRGESFKSLEKLAEGFETVTELVADLDRRETDQLAPPAGVVTLMTLHAAKGLEWSAVFLIGATEGLLPLVTDKGATPIDEERRLFYVGLTRARQRLVVTWPRHRLRSGSRHTVSRFVSDLQMGESSIVERSAGAVADPLDAARSGVHERGDGGSDGGVVLKTLERTTDREPPATCQVCGKALITGKERVLSRCLSCPSLADPAAVSALQVWRDQICEETNLPNYSVLTDASLELVAAKLPSSLAELRELPGLNASRVAAHGQGLLAAIQPFLVISNASASINSGPSPK